jgi:hypothetical protein
MDPDLYLRSFRRQTHELEQRLERRRVAEERATGAPAQGVLRVALAPRASLAVPVPAAPARTARGGHVARALRTRLDGWAARGRDAVRGAGGSDACCSPA